MDVSTSSNSDFFNGKAIIPYYCRGGLVYEIAIVDFSCFVFSHDADFPTNLLDYPADKKAMVESSYLVYSFNSFSIYYCESNQLAAFPACTKTFFPLR